MAKNPGFTPLSLLEQLKRRGRNRPEVVARLDLAEPLDLPHAKTKWLAALEEAERFVEAMEDEEIGCLYWSDARGRFEAPDPTQPMEAQGLVRHFGGPHGVLPRPAVQTLSQELL